MNPISMLVSLAVFIVMVAIVVYHRTMLIIARRESQQLSRATLKEREATADILRISKEVITAGTNEDELLSSLVKYLSRTLHADGAAALSCDNGVFYGCAVAGVFPPLIDVPDQIERQLIAHDDKHTEFFKGRRLHFSAADMELYCEDKGFAFFHQKFPSCFSDSFQTNAPRMLYAPIISRGETVGGVLVVSKEDFDSHQLSESDGRYLERLASLASMSIEMIRVIRERKEYEERLRTAKEEGMLQVSTGIIHNIGNAVTVAKLSVLELQEKLVDSEERPEDLIIKEILPRMRQELKSGSLQQFLDSDETGSQYFDIIAALLEHSSGSSKDSASCVLSLSKKLEHISEIIELQQRFMGELGTENMTQLSGVIESAIKIFEETCNKRDVEIRTEISPGTPEVLIDPSMMTQVLMNLIKNAVEAMDVDERKDKKHFLALALTSESGGEGENFVVAKVSDNGPGIPAEVVDKIFDFGFSTKGHGKSRGFGLHSCVDTVRKYNGKIAVESKLGEGTCFTIKLPVSRKNA